MSLFDCIAAHHPGCRGENYLFRQALLNEALIDEIAWTFSHAGEVQVSR